MFREKTVKEELLKCKIQETFHAHQNTLTIQNLESNNWKKNLKYSDQISSITTLS